MISGTVNGMNNIKFYLKKGSKLFLSSVPDKLHLIIDNQRLIYGHVTKHQNLKALMVAALNVS